MSRPRAMRVCGQPGCPTLTTGARCPEHQPKAWATSQRRNDLPPGWSTRTVPRILARDGHRCTATRDGLRCTATTGLEVHHVGNPDDHSDTNLATLCHPHHMAETLAEAAEARRRRRGVG